MRGRPPDELMTLAVRNHDGRSVTGFVGEGTPHFSARARIEGHRGGSVRAAGLDVQPVLEKHRRGRESPLRQASAKVVDEAFLPEDLTRAYVEAVQMSERSEAIQSVFRERDGGSRAGSVIQIAVLDCVRMHPQRLPGLGGETDDAFDFGRLRPTVHHVNPLPDDGHPGVSRADGGFPARPQACAGPCVLELRAVPRSVPTRPAPARPVFRGARARQRQDKQQRACRM